MRVRLLLAALLVGACSGQAERSIQTPHVGVTVLSQNIGKSAGIAWPRDEAIVFSRLPPGDGLGARVWTIDTSTAQTRQLELPEHERCRFTDFGVTGELPDGRIGLSVACQEQGIDRSHSLEALDIERRERSELVRVDFVPSMAAWHPRKAEILVSADSSICSGIALVDSRGYILQIPIYVGDGAQRFRIDKYITDPPDDWCVDYGLATLPTWSRDGERIAFVASPASVGVRGFGKSELPWNVYVMEPGEWRPRVVLSDIRFPRDLQWSPDGHWLASSAEVVGHGFGVWAIQPAGGRLVRLHDQEVGPIAWSPDGLRLAVTRTRPTAQDEFGRDELLLLEVGQALRA